MIAVHTDIVWQAASHVTVVVTVDLPDLYASGTLSIFPALEALEILPALYVLGLFPALDALGLLPALDSLGLHHDMDALGILPDLDALGSFSAFDDFVAVAVDLPPFCSWDTVACLAHTLC